MTATTLLVGGTGFLGRRVAARLVESREGRLATLVRAASDAAALPAQVELRTGDLDDERSIARALVGIKEVVFCASMGFGQVPSFVRLAEAARVKRAVFVSTTALFTTLPARSRAPREQAEAAVQGSGLDWTVLRPTMIYGAPGDRNIERLLRFLRVAPAYPLFGDGRALQQPVFVDDLALVVARSLDRQSAVGKAYNLAGAEPITYATLVRESAAALGRRVWLVHVPFGLALGAARLAEWGPWPAPIRVEQVLRLGEHKAFDYTEAARDLDFRPRSFRKGVRIEASRLRYVQLLAAHV